MPLQSQALKGDPALEACLISDPAHIVPGAAGPHVSKIQAALIQLDQARIDAGDVAARRYGPSTAAAVLAYKKKRNIINRTYQSVPDNIVGKMTIASLDAELLQAEPPPAGRDLGVGSKGKDVETLQRLLNRHLAGVRPPLVPDGVFGPNTETRVKEFQTLNRLYPTLMPITDPSVPRDPLKPTGIVDRPTLVPLIDFRVIGSDEAKFTPTKAAAAKASSSSGGGSTRAGVAPVTQAAPATPGGGSSTLRIVTLQAGGQASVNPWDFSPFLFSAQITLLAKNDGRPDFLLSGGGQIALNTSGANGFWTGQGFLQMGLGGIKKFGPLDLVNPFVQFMITHNEGASSGVNTVGAAIGNQITWSLITRPVGNDKQDVLNIFLNGQVASNVDLLKGSCAAPSGSFVLGAGYSFF